MSQKSELVIWPSNWPFETQENYLQTYVQKANLHKAIRKALSKKETKKEFKLDDIEFLDYTKKSSSHSQFTGIHNNTNDFLDIVFLTPTTAAEHESLLSMAEHIDQNSNLVYAEYFVDTKWQLLHEFNKFPYCYVLFFQRGALDENLMSEVLNRDVSEVNDDDLHTAFEELFNQSSSNRAELAKRLHQALEKGSQAENITKNYPKVFELIKKISEGGEYKPQQQNATLSPSFLKLKATNSC